MPGRGQRKLPVSVKAPVCSGLAEKTSAVRPACARMERELTEARCRRML